MPVPHMNSPTPPYPTGSTSNSPQQICSERNIREGTSMHQSGYLASSSLVVNQRY